MVDRHWPTAGQSSFGEATGGGAAHQARHASRAAWLRMLVLAVVTRCVVFLHTGSDVSALAGGDAVVFGPDPDIA
jgi:hypothetical protein